MKTERKLMTGVVVKCLKQNYYAQQGFIFLNLFEGI